MQANSLSRREFLHLSAFTAAAATLAACAPATGTKPAGPTQAPAEVTQAPESTAAPAPAGSKEVIFWHAWGSQVTEVLDKVAASDEFKSANPDLKVTTVPSKDLPALLTAIAGGEGCDGIANTPYFELYARGVCYPVTDWVANSSVIKKEDILSANWETAHYKGEMLGVPAIECFVRYGLACNVQLFEEAGLDVTKPPTTWDELYDIHEKLTKFDDAGNLKQLGFDPYDAICGSLGWGDPWIIPYSWGFSYYDAASQTFNINNPDMIDAWKTFTKFYDYVGAEKMAGFRESYGGWTAPNGSFTLGTQAIQINGYWTPGELYHLVPDRKFSYSWMPVPEKRRGKRVQVNGVGEIVVLKIAKQPEGMFKYAEFCNTDTGAGIIYDGLGWFPARRSFIEKVDTSKYPGLDWYVKSALDNDELGVIPPNPIEGQTAEFWNTLRAQVYFHKVTAEEGVAQMQAECEKALADMLKSG